MKIRDARKRDVEFLVGLNRKLTDYHRRLNKYNRSDRRTENAFRKVFISGIKSKNYKAIVAEDNDKIIGYISGGIVKPGIYTVPERIGEVYGFFVLEEYRKRGIGRRLFAKFIKWLKTMKIRNIEATVHLRNKQGFRTWKKFGLKEIRKIMHLKL